MKKLYEQPVAEIIELDAADIITASSVDSLKTSVNGNGNEGANVGKINYTQIKDALN